jgi:hypothetical protein
MVIMRVRRLIVGGAGAAALAAFAVLTRSPVEAKSSVQPENVAGIATSSIDLSGISLGDLQAKDADALAPFVKTVMAQVEQPRSNFGGSGPPGRRD